MRLTLVGSYQHQATSQASRSSGVYGLFRLDGGPVDPRDAAALGLTVPEPPGDGVLEAVDGLAPEACARLAEAGIVTVVAGVIEQRAIMARELDLPADACPARIARAALARFGAETPNRLAGEWSLLQWDRTDGIARLTLMGSAARRDPLFFARSGAHVAVAPDLFALGRIGWIGTELDEAGLLMMLGRAGLRSAAGARTMLRAVSRLGFGEGRTFTAGARPQELRCDVLALPPRWSGTAEAALTEAGRLLETIMHERMDRAGQTALLLSGGLDSALLAWASRSGNHDSARPLAFTSAVPDDSAIADEMPHARLVCQALGMPHLPITPGPELDSYRPSSAILAGSSGPTMANRHCLTEAFQQAARNRGVRLLFNGTYGEATLTARLPQTGVVGALRRLARAAIGRRAGPVQPDTPVDAFHVKLAPGVLARLPGEVEEAIAAPAAEQYGCDNEGLLGFAPVVAKALAHPNEFYAGAVRMDYPFRDLRLLRLFASLPLELVRALGADRGPARQLLAGSLPAAIVQRRRGLPADPEHYVRLQRQAPQARTRIGVFRRAGLDAWLDLDWLDGELAVIAGQGVSSVDQANLTQLTAITAEFLLWWQEAGRG